MTIGEWWRLIDGARVLRCAGLIVARVEMGARRGARGGGEPGGWNGGGGAMTIGEQATVAILEVIRVAVDQSIARIDAGDWPLRRKRLATWAGLGAQVDDMTGRWRK